MPTYTVRVPHLPPIAKAPVPLNVARNRATAGGYATQQQIAAYANGMLGKTQKKVLFSQTARPASLPTSWASNYIWGYFAGHTGPAVARARFEVVMVPGSTSASPPGVIKVILSQETGLSGAGTVTTPATIFATELSSATEPNRYSTAFVDFDITPDQDYRWQVVAYNGMRPFTCELYELPVETVDPSSATGAVDSTLIGAGQAVVDETTEDILVAADKLWRRSGPRLFNWTAPEDVGASNITRTSATYANTMDQAITTVSSTSPGWPTRVQYQNTLDSNNVPCVFWAHGGMTGGAGSGDIRILDDTGTVLATINVTAAYPTPIFHSATFNLDGTKATEKLDVQFRGDGTNQLAINGFGAFRYTS